MPRNPWVAIDATTSPTALARSLRQAWERFVAGGQPDGVRAPVADSWRRSLHAGVRPSGRQLPPIVEDGDEVSARREAHPLAQAAPLMRECLAGIGEDSRHLVVVSDADGVLLSIEGAAGIRSSAAASMNLVEGALWRERSAGTNAIGTALAADHAVQIFAAEHFKEIAHAWSGAAAPVHDPDTGDLLGTIDLTGAVWAVHPHSLAVVAAAAHAVETHMRCLLHERHDRLLSRYRRRIFAGPGRRALVTPTGGIVADHPTGWLSATRIMPPPGGGELVLPSGAHAFAEPLGHDEAFIVRAADHRRTARCRPLLKLSLLGRDHAGVEVDGRALALTRRHSEILALLWMQPAGMTGESLAATIYGDAGLPGAVRVAVHRLRKLLGPWIDTEPYRLSIDVECDVARVKSMLDRGAILQAVECYDGPLLPRSDAPGVVHARDGLDRWLRQAVMTADDDETLWAWVQSASGCQDLPAWKRLLAHMRFRDPRRSLAAAHVASLRAAYGREHGTGTRKAALAEIGQRGLT